MWNIDLNKNNTLKYKNTSTSFYSAEKQYIKNIPKVFENPHYLLFPKQLFPNLATYTSVVTNIISYPLQSTKVRKIFCQFGRKLLLSCEGDSSCCGLINTNSIKGLLKFKMACLINVQSKLSIDPQDHITKLMYRKINMIFRQNLVMGPRRGCVFDKKGCLQTTWGIWHHMGLTVKTIFSGLPQVNANSDAMEIMALRLKTRWGSTLN